MSKNRSKPARRQAAAAATEESGPMAAEPAAEAKPPFRPGTKQALILDLLRREEGAALNEIVAATGWLAHTTRAALTCLRKRGFAVEKVKTESGTRYFVRAA